MANESRKFIKKVVEILASSDEFAEFLDEYAPETKSDIDEDNVLSNWYSKLDRIINKALANPEISAALNKLLTPDPKREW